MITAPPLRRPSGKGRQKSWVALFKEHVELLPVDMQEQALHELRAKYFDVSSEGKASLKMKLALKDLIKDSIGIIYNGFEAIAENHVEMCKQIIELTDTLKRLEATNA